MMKIIVALICFMHLSLMAKSYDLDKIRLSFVKSIEDKETAENLLSELNGIKSSDPIIMAYKGSVTAIMGKHAWNPVSKLNYLKKGCNILNNAVDRDGENIEIRFLRFSLEHYLPAFLGYSAHLSIDKSKIIQLLKASSISKLMVSDTIKKQIIQFLLNSKRCSGSEVQQLKMLI